MGNMRADISGLNDPKQSQVSGSEADKAAGNYKGSQVQAVDIQSLIADAAEELTSELSEEAEKEVSDRDVEDGRKSDSLERIMRLAEVSETLKALGDLNKQALLRALKHLLERQDASARELREGAGQQFKEPAHQYCLLKEHTPSYK